jgi:hypothetical protein
MTRPLLQFRSIADFPLAWRWTSETHNLLAPEVLTDIRPLTETTASALADDGLARCPDAQLLGEAYAAESDEVDRVATRLRALPVSAETRVIVSWDSTTALETSWATFAKYWDAFCYPSSDDVTVWEIGAPWSVCYRHFEVMQIHFPDRAI